jgi:hypothetical protein
MASPGKVAHAYKSHLPGRRRSESSRLAQAKN